MEDDLFAERRGGAGCRGQLLMFESIHVRPYLQCCSNNIMNLFEFLPRFIKD